VLLFNKTHVLRMYLVGWESDVYSKALKTTFLFRVGLGNFFCGMLLRVVVLHSSGLYVSGNDTFSTLYVISA